MRGRWTMIENGIDLEHHRPAFDGDRAEAGWPLGLADRRSSSSPGRLGERKGQDVMLDAWPAVLRPQSPAE